MRTLPLVAPVLVPFLVVALALGGCGKKTTGDCQKLVQQVGPQHASLTAAFGRSDQSPSELETQAQGWEKAAQDLTATTFETEEVKALATQFAGVLTNAAKVRRALAASATDPAGLTQAMAQATAFMVEETKAKAAIDMTCR